MLQGIATGAVRGYVADVSGIKRLVTFPVVLVIDLGRNLFSVAMSSAMGVVTVFDSVRPRLEMGRVIMPMARLGDDHTLYFYMDVDSDSDGAAMRVESENLWRRRM